LVGSLEKFCRHSQFFFSASAEDRSTRHVALESHRSQEQIRGLGAEQEKNRFSRVREKIETEISTNRDPSIEFLFNLFYFCSCS
jgi:hypothetical protein